MNDNASEIIIELLEALQASVSDYPFSYEKQAIERAEDYLNANGYRRDSLTGESWIKER